MSNPTLHRVTRHGLAIGLLASLAHLGWEYAHGGVRSHHLLARPDLPAVSNWWGLLILPFLGWLASRWAARDEASGGGATARPVARFLGALLVGSALSFSFSAGFESVADVLFLACLAVGVVLPTFRGEYIFGFVLGMTFVVGSVLPTIAALLGASISAIAHFVVRPVLRSLVRAVRA